MKSSPQTLIQTNTRNYGIDALRILSMFMVLILHIMGQGGILDATSFPNPHYIATRALLAAVYCAVNCYALISGYVMINGKYRYTNLVLLWLQVALINVSGTLLFYAINPESVSAYLLLFSPFPVFRKTYWYFSAYCAVYLLIPLLNYAVHRLSRRQAEVLCVIILLFFSVFLFIINSDAFGLNNGYSTIWLILLYILGACIRKFNFGTNIKSVFLLGGYVLSILITVGFAVVQNIDTSSIFHTLWGNAELISYTSPTILFNSIALLLLFSRMKISRQWIIKVIQLLSAVGFGVYILHTQPQINIFLFGEARFAAFADYPIPLMLLAVLVCAAAMFVFFAAIDKLRLLLFDKLKLKKRLLTLEEKYIGDLWSSKENNP